MGGLVLCGYVSWAQPTRRGRHPPHSVVARPPGPVLFGPVPPHPALGSQWPRGVDPRARGGGRVGRRCPHHRCRCHPSPSRRPGPRRRLLGRRRPRRAQRAPPPWPASPRCVQRRRQPRSARRGGGCRGLARRRPRRGRQAGPAAATVCLRARRMHGRPKAAHPAGRPPRPPPPHVPRAASSQAVAVSPPFHSGRLHGRRGTCLDQRGCGQRGGSSRDGHLPPPSFPTATALQGGPVTAFAAAAARSLLCSAALAAAPATAATHGGGRFCGAECAGAPPVAVGRPSLANVSGTAPAGAAPLTFAPLAATLRAAVAMAAAAAAAVLHVLYSMYSTNIQKSGAVQPSPRR